MNTTRPFLAVFALAALTGAVVPTATFAAPANTSIRDCSLSAKRSVERMDIMNPQTVDSIVEMTAKQRADAIVALKTNGARASGLSPAGHQLLLLALEAGGDPNMRYFVAKVGKAVYLSMADASSCGPYAPVRLR